PFAPFPSRVTGPNAADPKSRLVHKVRRSAYAPAIAFFFGLLSVLLCFSAPVWAIACLRYFPEDLRSTMSCWAGLLVTGLGVVALTLTLVRLAWKWLLTSLLDRKSPSINRSRLVGIAMIGIGLLIVLGTLIFGVLWVRPFFWMTSSKNPRLDTVI